MNLWETLPSGLRNSCFGHANMTGDIRSARQNNWFCHHKWSAMLTNVETQSERGLLTMSLKHPLHLQTQKSGHQHDVDMIHIIAMCMTCTNGGFAEVLPANILSVCIWHPHNQSAFYPQVILLSARPHVIQCRGSDLLWEMFPEVSN